MNTNKRIALACLVSALAAHARGGDFNADGRDDLVVASPFERVGANEDAGIVHVFYGASLGPSKIDEQVWSETALGFVSSFGEVFGNAIATGDFNGDGFDDLAIGALGEAVNNLGEAGAVFVAYGSPIGLRAVGAQMWTQDSKGIKDKVEAEPGTIPPRSDEAFGRVLAAGDFDGDGRDDLAIGVRERVGKGVGLYRAGAVHVLRGSKTGLTAKGNQLWHPGVKGVPGDVVVDQEFGIALCAGDFNADGRDDLAIGSPDDPIDVDSRGSVTVLFGAKKKGLATKGVRRIVHTDVGGAADSDHPGFGRGLAAGDFDADGDDDLAIGVPGLTVSALAGAGGVYEIAGSSAGLDLASATLWHQNIAGVDGAAAAGEAFGYVLATGNFDGDAYADLAVGIPDELWGGNADAGGVLWLQGSSTGLITGVGDLWHEGDGACPETAEPDDQLGAALAVGDFNGDGYDDLATGAPTEQVGAEPGAGGVLILLGSAAQGIVDVGSLWFDQSDPEIDEDENTDDWFGGALGA